MFQERLFRLAPCGVALTATFVGGEGWRLMLAVRRQDEAWPPSAREHYDHLSTVELYDVICAEVARLLDLA